MKLGHTVKRAIFTSSPLILGIIAAQAGCSSAPAASGAAAASGDVDMGTIIPPDEDMELGPGDDPATDLPGFKGSGACKKCHTSIYEQWESSMHAHGLTSPIMVAQANQVFAADLLKNENEGLSRFCVNCHGPISTLFARDSNLPFTPKKANATAEALLEGISCVTCHSYRGNPRDAKAVSTDISQDFSVGKNYFGPFSDPVPNGGFHQATTSPLYTDGVENLCLNCHNVKNDRDGDKKFELGVDLFLQTTFDEYNLDYRAAGNGKDTCLACHMPDAKNINQAADGFPGAPPRDVHNHEFAGTDYPLDLFAAGEDPQREGRHQLLQGGGEVDPAASLTVQNVVFDGTNLSFTTTIGNENGGHNLPTGFAFTRQMWLEVIVEDNEKFELAQSGELQRPNNDLCDNDTLKDNLGPIIQGCQDNVPDPQLVNFQTILVDFVALDNGVLVKDPLKGHETHLQFQTGGAVPRSRPADVAAGLGLNTLAPIKAFDTRTFAYNFVLAPQDEDIRLKVSLKFRNLPPYFVRRLAQAEGPKDVLGNLLSFDVVDMITAFQQVPVGAGVKAAAQEK